MWFDALGRRLPFPYLPGYDTLGTLRYLRTTPEIAGYDHSWFILTQKIIEREFALSGSEQNPTSPTPIARSFLKERLLSKGAPAPVEAFKQHGADFVVAGTIEELVTKMNTLTDEPLLDVAPSGIRSLLGICRWPTRTPKMLRCKVFGIPGATSATGSADRGAAPILDPQAGPLIGVKLHILTERRWAASKPTCRPARSATTATRSTVCTLPVKWPDSAAVACTVQTRWRARSSAVACSPRAAGRPPPTRCDQEPGTVADSYELLTSRFWFPPTYSVMPGCVQEVTRHDPPPPDGPDQGVVLVTYLAMSP